MRFLVEVQHPFAPDERWDERWYPEVAAEAVQRYLNNTPGLDDPEELEKRLSKGEQLEWGDIDSDRLVTARRLD